MTIRLFISELTKSEMHKFMSDCESQAALNDLSIL